MTAADLLSLTLLASHLLCAALGYRAGRLYPRRRPDLAPKQRRRKRCPACRQFTGTPKHRCPLRYAVR